MGAILIPVVVCAKGHSTFKCDCRNPKFREIKPSQQRKVAR